MKNNLQRKFNWNCCDNFDFPLAIVSFGLDEDDDRGGNDDFQMQAPP